jgi:transcription elongation factor GreA
VAADAPKDAVTLGSIVRVRDLEFDEEQVLEIVGSQEANPSEGKVSDDSPLGRGLHGHRVGETVTIEAPVGELQFTIISLENR